MKSKFNKMPLRSCWVIGLMFGTLLGATACGSNETGSRINADLKIERQPLSLDELKKMIQTDDYLPDTIELADLELNGREKAQLNQLEADYARYASRVSEIPEMLNDEFCDLELAEESFEIAILQYGGSEDFKVLSQVDLRQLEVGKEYSYSLSSCIDAKWKVLRNNESEFWAIIKTLTPLQKGAPAAEASYEKYISFKKPTYSYTLLELSATNQFYWNGSGTKFLPVEKANAKMLSIGDVENDEEGIANRNWKAADLQIFGKSYGMRTMSVFLNGIESEDDEDEWESSSSY